MLTIVIDLCIDLYKYLSQVEKVFGSVNPNPAEVEKAKRVLRVRSIFIHVLLWSQYHGKQS